MVNKALLSLAAVVLFAVFGTGVFVGMQVGGLGGGGPAEATATETAQASTPTSSDGTPAATPATPTPEPEQDAETVDEREDIRPREFNQRNISVAIAENINDARAAEGLARLSTTGSTTETVQQMAAGHTDAMADAGLVRHTLDGVTSTDRYKNNGLYDTCKFQVKSYIENADNNDLETVGRTYAGQEYPDNGTTQFNENDTAVANALTDDWLSTQIFRNRLLVPNADRIGVGVTVTSTGTVYATVNLC